MKQIHILGRQVLAALNALIIGFLAYNQVEMTPELIAALSGPTLLYTAVKGKGKEVK